MKVSLIIVWGIKRYAIKNVKRLYKKIGGLDHLEATKGLLRKLEAVKENLRPFLKVDHRLWGIKASVIKKVYRPYKNFRGLVRLEAIRGRFRELEAVFESF